VGAFLGEPWLVNPVLNGLCVLLAYALVRELASRRTARLVALLLVASALGRFINN
jgi:asparagine N-glycosylation enzyme membrane subunit Stt3